MPDWLTDESEEEMSCVVKASGDKNRERDINECKGNFCWEI